MVREIQLTQGKVALVDDEDYERVSALRWHYNLVKGKNCFSEYAKHTGYPRVDLLLHRFVMMTTSRSSIVDHKNGNGLDCRRSNLRVTDKSGNAANQRKSRGLSRFKGVTLIKKSGRWLAQTKVLGKRLYLGTHSTEEGAARAYDVAAKAAFGEFALLNFPEVECA